MPDEVDAQVQSTEQYQRWNCWLRFLAQTQLDLKNLKILRADRGRIIRLVPKESDRGRAIPFFTQRTGTNEHVNR